MTLTSIISGIFTIAFTWLQMKYPVEPLFAVINNISICVLTGGIISIVQSILAFHNTKKESILEFYRQAIVLENNIAYYPYMRAAFVKFEEGLSDVQSIMNQFNREFLSAYHRIDKTRKRDEITQVVITLFGSYREQMLVFKKMEKSIIEAIRFSDMTDEKLISQEIDIKLETLRHNDILFKNLEEIKNQYNDENIQKIDCECFDKLEMYIYGSISVKSNMIQT